MTHPTSNQLHDLFKALRKAGAEVMSLEQQLHRAIRRDRAGSTSPDGYPRTTSSGNRASGQGSAVEGAAVALAEGSVQRDSHHALTRDAVRALEDAVVAIRTLRSRLASISDLTTDEAPSPRTCEHCTPHLPAASARRVHRRGTVGDRLTRAMDLCRECYLFTYRSSAAGSYDGELPTADQITHHDRTGTWRVRVA